MNPQILANQINEKGHLTIGGVDTVDLAKEYGTPLVVYDVEQIRNQIRAFKKVFEEEKVAYAVSYASKAFACIAMYQVANEEGAYTDVVSAGELYTALKAHFPTERISFHGNNKSLFEIEMAVKNHVGKIIIDNFHEIKLLDKVLREQDAKINVMGEVMVPGTYRLSSFSTVFHALYRAGGISNIGSLRNIRVMRGGKQVAAVDVYDYILKGKLDDDIRLEEGDVIIVPPYDMLVDIEGNVKRPMYYEMKQGETMATLIRYAGGFAGDAYTEEVRVIRRTGRENRLFSVQESDYVGWKLEDGDAVTVGAILDRFANRVEIRGSVYRPGMYELGGTLNTVKDLVARANGLTGDAFQNRVLLTREREDLTHEVIAIDLAALLAGRVPDIPLQREDVLVIPSIHELEAKGAFTVSGEVTRPGIYPYVENTTLEDLLVQAGGLLESASTVKVDVSRRIKDPESTEPGSELSKIFTFSVKEGYVIDGTPGFVLEPFDVVEVRRSPGYQVQRRVTIAGEAVFAGGYTLIEKNERLSDLVKRAGGLTPDAYVKGGRLIRQMNEEERAQRQAALDMALMNAGSDSISVAKLRLSDRYTVGIELDKALANPGSDYDVVLREGDYLYIPEYISTVKITGEVQYPNTVTYLAGKGTSYYIEQAGGYGKMAKKRRAYVVHMNGTVSRLKRFRRNKIEPGSQIIIPSKKERKGVNIAEIMALTTSAASIGTMAATIANLTK